MRWESDDKGLIVRNKMLGCMLGFTKDCQDCTHVW